VRLILYGRPITKKNSSRIVKCGNYHRILPSKAYEKYEKECLLQITGKYKLKLDGKYNLKCLYYMPTRHRVDLVNLLEATCDILVAGHVIADDNSKIIVSHDGSRVLYDRVNPRVEIFLEEVVSKNGQ
jgi:hypothetical protein